MPLHIVHDTGTRFTHSTNKWEFLCCKSYTEACHPDVSTEVSCKTHITGTYVCLDYGWNYWHQEREKSPTSPEEIWPRKMVVAARYRLGPASALLEVALGSHTHPVSGWHAANKFLREKSLKDNEAIDEHRKGNARLSQLGHHIALISRSALVLKRCIAGHKEVKLEKASFSEMIGYKGIHGVPEEMVLSSYKAFVDL